jgi:single-strand DNA-binding protein
MSKSLNRVTLIGYLGKDPETRTMPSGDLVCNFSMATSESWIDDHGGKQERTQWHQVVIFNQGLAKIANDYLKKGSRVLVEGQLENRQWEDKEGQTRYATEVVARPFKGELVLLDPKP